MSRSRRLPYSAITGHSSAKQDKVQARRGVRSAERQAIRSCQDWEELMLPHKYECNWNDTWSWHRDGSQSLQKLDHQDFNPFYLTAYSFYESLEELMDQHCKSIKQQRDWIVRCTRK